MLYIDYYSSPLGKLTLSSDGHFLTGLWFEKQNHFGETCGKKNHITKAEGKNNPQDIVFKDSAQYPEDAIHVFSMTKQWLDDYFSGKIPSFTPPLKVEGSDFKKMVAEIMLTIPYGKTLTYGEIAKECARRMGKDHMSAQAVGGAVGHNAIGIIIPCHRVIGANGNITGYAGGIDKKEFLLKLEFVSF